jgi:membrane-bound ClpP family serine protease
MIVAIGLGILGLILIYFEFFVPGGILGVLGGVFILAGISLSIWEQRHMYWVFLYVLALVFLLVFTIRFALWKLKQKPSFYASDDQEGYLASKFDRELIGKEGKTITNLKPSGHIEVDGVQYQAVSESSYIKKGESVKIVGGEGARYKVRKHDG